MIYIKNKYYPIKGFVAITHWPFVFYKKMNIETKTHEDVHGKQQSELLLIFFYLIYLIEWALKGYKNISFEKEAYEYEKDPTYLVNRKPYSWIKYL